MTGSEIAEMLRAYPVVVPLPVQWGDMDAYQHVNNVVYFRWFETARIAYTWRLGLGESMRQSRVGPILAAIGCDYRRQITYPDRIYIGSRVTRIGRTSLNMEHAVVSEEAGAVAAEGHSTLVVYDYEARRPVPVPDSIRRAVAVMENWPLDAIRPPEAL